MCRRLSVDLCVQSLVASIDAMDHHHSLQQQQTGEEDAHLSTFQSDMDALFNCPNIYSDVVFTVSKVGLEDTHVDFPLVTAKGCPDYSSGGSFIL